MHPTPHPIEPGPPGTGHLPKALLDELRFRADPLADATIARILGPWAETLEGADAAELIDRQQPRWQRLEAVTRAFAGWACNADVQAWRPPADLPRDIAAALVDYLSGACTLPTWADAALIARAEQVFFEHGPLSCALLFCASLPECYVVPDLAEVLHATGQLEQRTEYRVRSTAAMVFPVMMRGGLATPQGGGVAQVLKVRLIHATVRNLLLRGEPAQAVAALSASGPERAAAGAGFVEPLAALRGTPHMHHALYAHGWKLGDDGLPCNQEELAYTLLTFGYVFLRGLRTLGLGLSAHDEAATLHAWNVMASLVGVEERLMAHTMAEAEALFAQLQARGRADRVAPDPRAPLGRALMRTLADAIPLGAAKSFPLLLSRELCGAATSRDIGIDGASLPVPWTARALFGCIRLAVRGIDALGRCFSPEFSITRTCVRMLGYHFVSRLLMDQTRPLKLPEPVRSQVRRTMAAWGHDPRAPRWLNTLEDGFTVKGQWDASPR
ncbi:MAG TPA: oxygenase MpaB family protein [Methylibium sp.]|uniref:oxygenase MpaB family protein n=1 Tax=Methylibium sp. TaxID=2067992 RepID=UPI002DB5A77F|nr:oxygenase MpaB family protein [Methylibium sp.]HEU4459399.1 oxygenase MpaB family protein [Methylibium sp.]